MSLLDDWEQSWPDVRQAWLEGRLEPYMKVDPMVIGSNGATVRWDPVAECWCIMEEAL